MSNILISCDKKQAELMKEECILVSEDDKERGSASKKDCHLMERIKSGDALHRAFSVFLFDRKSKSLLLQQRAPSKITFPLYWTNTCCSHPLYSINIERVSDNEIGVRHAARRKLNQELGISNDAIYIQPDSYKFITRILYEAKSCDIWGEHEIDYILWLEVEDKNDVKLNLNENEVKDIKWVSIDECKLLLNDNKMLLTPWFRLICEHVLFKWWDDWKKSDKIYEDKDRIYKLI